MNNNHQEIEELRSIRGSRAYYNLLKKRTEHLQKGVNQAVKDQNLIKAYGELCKLEDLKTNLRVIDLRITELEKDNG